MEVAWLHYGLRYYGYHSLGPGYVILYQGEKLRKMLLEHGSFDAVEIQLKKWKEEKEEEELMGGWHTQVSLEMENWTECFDSNH